LRNATDKGFKTADVNGIKAIEIKEPTEYQLSGKFLLYAYDGHKSRNYDECSAAYKTSLTIIQRSTTAAFTYRYEPITHNAEGLEAPVESIPQLC
jgi:hypothetical protein